MSGEEQARCPECGTAEKRFGDWVVRAHRAGCLRGWSGVGGEFASANGRAEARRATDEAVELDEKTLQRRRNSGGAEG
jgi:hypothetical protein